MSKAASEEREVGQIPRGLAAVDLAEPNTIRLLSTAHVDEPAVAPLGDDDTELDILNDLERMTSIRQDEEMPLPSGLKRSELVGETHGYGWTYVNAAFCYTRPEGSRFNGPERGAWYATLGPDAIDTALAEVSYHLTRELENTGVFENVTDYRELIAGFIGTFVDLRNQNGEDALHADPSIGYPAGQALTREIRCAGYPGIVYPSVRHEGGTCLAAFRTTVVQNVRQGRTWRLEWTGNPSPNICQL